MQRIVGKGRRDQVIILELLTQNGNGANIGQIMTMTFCVLCRSLECSNKHEDVLGGYSDQ